METPTKNLVVVRAGDHSQHVAWLAATPPEGRNWDLAVSYYGADFTADHAPLSHFHAQPGGKWLGLYEFFAANPEALEQ
ncbi:MAG: hypothetical protein KKB37_12095 [Alphaproteobacteria bacterium]|nr:hypothetical protein [Alphaproteobacteria bacterium]